ISELADRFIRDPHSLLTVNQKVSVTVIDVDMKRHRIALSMRTNPLKPRAGKEKKRSSGEKGTDGTHRGDAVRNRKPAKPSADARTHEP
ncbi:MAG: S1 RNA-binding domain-containing protein, partial [Syntrophaceae bacterium]|nr:S1 RNA-binding domain-containing protein [Syntrophaceae bacterium]